MRLGPHARGNVTTLDTTASGTAGAPGPRVAHTVAHPNPAVRIIRTGPRGLGNPTSDFATLLNTVRDAGLLRRRRAFYILVFLGISVAMAGAWLGFAYLRGTWYELLIAGALGILFTQYAFLGHESSHRQVFDSARVNDTVARWLCDLVVGISYSWWMNKHSRHHAQPNTVDRDPDIERDFLVFQEKQARELRESRHGPRHDRAGFSSPRSPSRA